MMDFKIPPSKLFTSQEEVDQYVLQTEEIAKNTFDEENAIKLYQHVAHLRTVEELFFVPSIVLSWEEMALSYIESDEAIFSDVYYPQMKSIYQNGVSAFKNLEIHVQNNHISKKTLFGMIHGFNTDLKTFNQYCKRYGKKPFPLYQCSDQDLNQEYKEWREELYG